MNPFTSPCSECQHSGKVIPPCPNSNSTSPKIVMVAQAPGSGALCSRHICRYNWHLKPNDVTARRIDWVFHCLGVQDSDLLIVNALRCANQCVCYHECEKAENTKRTRIEYERCSWALREVIAPQYPKVILLMGQAAKQAFCDAFKDHPDIQVMGNLDWETTVAFGESTVTLLSHPGQLGLNARWDRHIRRDRGDDKCKKSLVFLRDVEVALKQRFSQFVLNSPVPSLQEFNKSHSADSIYPECSCHKHPGNPSAKRE